MNKKRTKRNNRLPVEGKTKITVKITLRYDSTVLYSVASKVPFQLYDIELRTILESQSH